MLFDIKDCLVKCFSLKFNFDISNSDVALTTMNQFPIVVDFSFVNWNQFTKLFWFLSQFASSKRFIGKKSFQTAKLTASSPISRLPQRIDKNVIKLRRSRQIYIWWFSDEQLLGFCVVNVKLFYDYFIHPRDMMCCYGNHSNVLDKLHFAVQMRRVLARSQQIEQKEVFIAVSVEWNVYGVSWWWEQRWWSCRSLIEFFPRAVVASIDMSKSSIGISFDIRRKKKWSNYLLRQSSTCRESQSLFTSECWMKFPEHW